jgi:serine/threonine-protein kinase
MTITNYTIKQSIGQGGMATVYLAEDIKFQTNVALKVLNKEYVHNDNIRKRFIAEARNMFKMSHPNIIKVTDLIDDGDTVAFVMEYIEGETLKEYIERKGKLSDEEIKTIFTQMLEAVGYVHEQNLVHRDIKPSNFMITSKGQIKLLDFGIAKNTDSSSAEYTQTGTGIQMGTPLYMSPEQITETKSVNAQSDIYSLGVVLWQMVTGQKPYDTNTLSSFQLQMKIVQEELPKTNTNWDVVIEKATHKKIENRFQSCNSIFVEYDNEITLIQSRYFSVKKQNVSAEPTIFENKTEYCGTNYYTIDNILEVYSEDIGSMNFLESVKICSDLGIGWRLPNLEELRIIYEKKDEIGSFSEVEYYWTNEIIEFEVKVKYFYTGYEYFRHKQDMARVRPVRTKN